MTALQVSIGTLNDLVDAPRDAGRKPGKPIPAGLVTPRDRSAWSWSSRPRSGSLLAVAVRAGDRRPGRSSSWRSATATTSSPRARPGRGCRSRSGSRCCRSSAGSGRPATLPPAFASSSRWPSSPAPRWRSPTPARTSSATPPPASIPWRSASARDGPGLVEQRVAPGRHRRRDRHARWRPAPARPVIAAAIGRRARHRSRHRPRARRGTRPGASGPGSSRRSGSGCSPRPGWRGSPLAG